MTSPKGSLKTMSLVEFQALLFTIRMYHVFSGEHLIPSVSSVCLDGKEWSWTTHHDTSHCSVAILFVPCRVHLPFQKQHVFRFDRIRVGSDFPFHPIT